MLIYFYKKTSLYVYAAVLSVYLIPDILLRVLTSFSNVRRFLISDEHDSPVIYHF